MHKNLICHNPLKKKGLKSYGSYFFQLYFCSCQVSCMLDTMAFHRWNSISYVMFKDVIIRVTDIKPNFNNVIWLTNVNFKFDLIMVWFGTILFNCLFSIKVGRFQFQLLIQVLIKRRRKNMWAQGLNVNYCQCWRREKINKSVKEKKTLNLYNQNGHLIN